MNIKFKTINGKMMVNPSQLKINPLNEDLNSNVKRNN